MLGIIIFAIILIAVVCYFLRAKQRMEFLIGVQLILVGLLLFNVASPILVIYIPLFAILALFEVYTMNTKDEPMALYALFVTLACLLVCLVIAFLN